MTHAAVDVRGRVHVCIPVSSSVERMPRSGIAGSCGNSVFNFFEDLSNSSLHIPTSSVGEFLFLPILNSACYFLFLFCGSHRSGCEVVAR